MKRNAVLTLCTLLAPACAGPGAEWGGTMTDSAGVVLVQNPAAANWTLADRPQVAEELRIGAVEGAPEYQFGQIAAVDVAEDGRIFVLDQQAAHVRVFDADGRYVRTVGKPGGGPGELSAATMAVLIGAGDSLYVADMLKQRIVRFSPDGVETGSVPVLISDGMPVNWTISPDRRLVTQVRPLALPGAPAAPDAGRDRVLLRDARGEVSDTLLVIESGNTIDFSGGTMRMKLFEAEPVWTLLQDGRLVHGRNDTYRLNVLARDGTVERVITRPAERAALTETDRAAFLKLLGDAMSQQAPPQVVEQLLQNVQFASHYPVFARIMGGPDNTLWVQHVRTAQRAQQESGTFDAQDVGAPEWDVFDAEGRLLGTIRMPPKFQPLRVVGSHVYGVSRDDMDVQYVVRLRIGQTGRQ